MTILDAFRPKRRPTPVPEAEAKAATGPGVAMIQYGSPLSSWSRTPQKLMREAQALYHTNPWIASAERTVTRRVIGLPWHLEDEQDEEIDEEATGPASVVRQVLERPQAALQGVGRKMTRRELWSITSRHLGLCGMAYWYLDQMDMAYGFPMGIIYVNPARVWAVESDTGNLTGWVIDPKDESGRGGTPVGLNEMLPFYLDPPDSGNYGTGLVETAGLKAKITQYADQHAAFVLATGGRMAGIVAPKAGVLNEDQFAKVVREFRNVAEAPDAAKRLTILEGPVDYITTAATPSELALIDLSTMNRDDILAIWGVPPALAGIPAPAGLNSGESRKLDEATLMQGAVHDRVVSMTETIQYGLLDRLPFKVELEVEEPTFDDDAPAYSIAASARDLPLTNAERRAIVGLDPFGRPDIDEAIWLPVGLTEAYASATGPAPASPPEVEMEEPPEGEGGPEEAMKASRLDKLRTQLERTNKPAIERAVAAILREQRDEIAAWIRSHAEHVLKRPNDTRGWWRGKEWDKRLEAALSPFYARTADAVHGGVAANMKPGKADPVASAITETLLLRAGRRITGINEFTRDAVLAVIRNALAEGFAEGAGAARLGELVEQATAFDQYRAERIARTETMWAYNVAAIESYRDFGVEYVEAHDGDEDEACAERNGRIFTLEESLIETEAEHPNGTLDWSPVVGYEVLEVPAKGADVNEADVRRIVAEMQSKAEAQPAAVVTMPIHVAPPAVYFTPPAQEAPTINVHVPEAEAPVVNVTVPEAPPAQVQVTNVMPEEKAAEILNVRIIEAPMTRQKVIRDSAGRIIETQETEAY